MKKEISSLDLHYLAIEWKSLIDSKIDKIYDEGDAFLFQLHMPNEGKKLLKIMLPSFCFLTENKEQFPPPDAFGTTLRKYLENSRIREIRQMGFERIMEVRLENKEGFFSLFIELFNNGNIIMCRDDRTIIIARNYHKWKDRTVRGGIPYTFPARECNFLEMSKEDLTHVVTASQKESIVKTLAIELGLGGTYAEEICMRAGVDKNKKSPDKKETEAIFEAAKSMREEKINPCVYEGEFSPFPLNKYEGMQCTKFETFNSAVEYYHEHVLKSLQERKPSKSEREMDKLEKIISQQKVSIESLKEETAELQKKGELIYEKYSLISGFLSQIQKAREKYSWKEIREKLKDHPTVKEINEKDGKITLDL